ncbi:hypothetical protein [Hymenobacter sp. BT491]|uniref:hypothetical protein n=1 Tax=Hymenobacter sp. BT491 TaxID=2766779 RepID=UPI0016539EBA|nr:hypothetical protein [Hymenobacter sp. BT491]MBC6988943.1 hypothetical protein [Hymenobacter sp. BT491]
MANYPFKLLRLTTHRALTRPRLWRRLGLEDGGGLCAPGLYVFLLTGLGAN